MKRYKQLFESPQYKELDTPNQKAIYKWMSAAEEGGWEDDSWMDKYDFKKVFVPAHKFEQLFKDWGWDIKPVDEIEKERVDKIIKAYKETHKLWPYIIGTGKTWEEFAEDEINHGDGYHRVMAYLQLGIKKIPVIFWDNGK